MLELRRRLDALADRHEIQSASQGQHGVEEYGTARTITVADKGPIDLQLLHGQTLQTAERRMSGSEIIDREREAFCVQFHQRPL